mmetsp:Transcript_12845/g.43425  ORF Transcript_12845/g.43425 Transcript_12845/m.43425 type:complete len:258 (-) Transcript_12845:51-824(-)
MYRLAVLAALVAGGGAFVPARPVSVPARRLASSTVDDKVEVREYFNTAGFERWNKIYSDSDEVNKVQLDIRTGHDQTVDKVLEWADELGVKGKTVCDAGCGVGSLALPLARLGARIQGSDISEAMTAEAARRAKAEGIRGAKFFPSDLEALTGRFDIVTCMDVMIHYPTDKMEGMVSHLASLSKEHLVVSFAPKTPWFVVLKKIGELFPGPSKTTRAYLHEEASVRRAVRDAGFEVVGDSFVGTSFYFSKTLFCKRA